MSFAATDRDLGGPPGRGSGGGGPPGGGMPGGGMPGSGGCFPGGGGGIPGMGGGIPGMDGGGCFDPGPDLGTVLGNLGQQAFQSLATAALGQLLAVKDSDPMALAIGKHLASQFGADIYEALKNPDEFWKKIKELFNGVESFANMPVALGKIKSTVELAGGAFYAVRWSDDADILPPVGPDIGPIIEGNPTILVGKKPVARLGHIAVGLGRKVGQIILVTPRVLVGATSVLVIPDDLIQKMEPAAGSDPGPAAADKGTSSKGPAPGTDDSSKTDSQGTPEQQPQASTPTEDPVQPPETAGQNDKPLSFKEQQDADIANAKTELERQAQSVWDFAKQTYKETSEAAQRIIDTRGQIALDNLDRLAHDAEQVVADVLADPVQAGKDVGNAAIDVGKAVTNEVSDIGNEIVTGVEANQPLTTLAKTGARVFALASAVRLAWAAAGKTATKSLGTAASATTEAEAIALREIELIRNGRLPKSAGDINDRQKIHKPGTNENKTRSESDIKKGSKPPTAWRNPGEADQTTLEAYDRGRITARYPDGSPKTVVWDAGRAVGSGGQSQVTVQLKPNGSMHGYPSGPGAP